MKPNDLIREELRCRGFWGRIQQMSINYFTGPRLYVKILNNKTIGLQSVYLINRRLRWTA